MRSIKTFDDLDALIGKSQLNQPHLNNTSTVTEEVYGKRQRKRKETGVLHDWYGMEKRKLDAETRQDLAMIQYRDFVPSADGRHRIAKYKKRALPQYFEMGTVIDGAVDFHKGKKAKSQRMTDQYLEEEYTQQFVKEAQAKAKAESKLKRRKPKVSTAKRRSVNFQVTKNRRGK
mmetsp:Transcript_4665/g.7466  ORF Transcript_4665/g.7466 Transcript_4665/m.7466 type:complete len:174 (-) Transcript_4665:174-695(-)|eukprot:CAMPEP_0174363706 /NCGR_PEP_ID=MMETSP0811_2-20130205/69900_1 /TAXON_ID=73025 ORGANISM="Eutreptiella gymnastica-like, Strain CCMP1594" /NCGR_SAMPLE_ID=MMETSP0811_2 /ASSEMBLY_ACC=CAM_ASM_000667 /LENGTH=173 /DNA_ID=CAMNT_0015502635 /DNA_START=88 /DNA_END=609 /DNA_ORIENTATION=+